MIKSILFLALILVGTGLNAQKNDCNNIPQNWNTNKQAIAKIENSDFIIRESASPSGESWMNSANFYSCGKDHGYLIVRGKLNGTKVQSFVHQEVPTEIWNAFKGARSMGGFYLFYLKGKHELVTQDTASPPL